MIRWRTSGHTDDMFNIERDVVTHKAIGVNYIAPSVSPRSSFLPTGKTKDPSFSVISIDQMSGLPVDFETYSFNLTLANNNEKPKWYKKYNFKDTFGIQDLRPANLYNYAVSQLANTTKLDGSQCDSACRLNQFCRITSNNYDDYSFCTSGNKQNFLSWQSI